MTVFPIAPAASRYLWFVVPVSVILIGLVALFIVSVRGAHASSFEVTADGLRLRGDLYSRTIPRSQLDVTGARRVNLTSETGLRPVSRRLGTALPGYLSGWFRLANGEKALLYLTDRAKAVYVPTTAGYSLLLSPADPDAFVATLRSRRR